MNNGHGPRSFAVEIATGGDPVRALLRATCLLPMRPGEVWDLAAHDDDCPALDTGPMRVCTCKIVELRGTRAV